MRGDFDRSNNTGDLRTQDRNGGFHEYERIEVEQVVFVEDGRRFVVKLAAS